MLTVLEDRKIDIDHSNSLHMFVSIGACVNSVFSSMGALYISFHISIADFKNQLKERKYEGKVVTKVDASERLETNAEKCRYKNLPSLASLAGTKFCRYSSSCVNVEKPFRRLTAFQD